MYDDSKLVQSRESRIWIRSRIYIGCPSVLYVGLCTCKYIYIIIHVYAHITMVIRGARSSSGRAATSVSLPVDLVTSESQVTHQN